MKHLKTSSALIIAALAFVGCAEKETVVREGAGGNSALSLNANAITVAPAPAETCPAGGAIYTLFIDTNNNGVLDSNEVATNQQTICSGVAGASGSAGSSGSNGSNGYSLVFQPVAASAAQCPAGGTMIVMAQDTNRNNVYDSEDANAQTITLCNGTNGTNGTNGSNAVLPAYTPVAPIYPCGNTVAYKEVLLRLNNGEILSSFSDNTSGSMTRLTFIPDGTYMDTDNSSCQFSIATSADRKSRSISWSGQVQETWALTN